MRRSYSGTPFVTDNLADIDLELELLQRKRKMIELQREMLTNEHQYNQRQFSFDQPRQMYSNQQQISSLQSQNYNINHDYSQLYENRPETSSNIYGNQLGTKRKANDVIWQSNSPPKRIARPRNRPKKSYKQGQGSKLMSQRSDYKAQPQPFSNNPKPLMSLNPIKSFPNKQSTIQKPISKANTQKSNFKAKANLKRNRISKAKASIPNNLNSYSLSERKNLVATASHLVTEKVSQDMTLYPDKEPSRQVTGRLELALGKILKEVKTQINDEELIIITNHSTSTNRLMKQIVRERIRQVMLGKVVGDIDNIVSVYRASYPKETDTEIIKQAIEAQRAKDKEVETVKVDETDTPEKYFKHNMMRIIVKRLDDLFKKVEDVYKKDNEKNEVAENETEIFPSENEKQDEIKETNPNDTEVNEPSKEDKRDESVSKESSSNKIQYYQEIMDKMLARKLPHILPKYKDTIIRLMDLDHMYKKTKEEVIANTKNKIKAHVPDENQTSNISSVESSKDGEIPRPLPYYVKLFGRQYLPKRKLMENFLNEFHPKSIKKHKYVHNLLFIGFNNKEDFDNILAKNGITIGQSKLFIKVSENKKYGGSNQTEGHEKVDNAVEVIEDRKEEHIEDTNVESKTDEDEVQIIEDSQDSANEVIEIEHSDKELDNTQKNDSSDSKELFSEELDNQITDLLSSIREEEAKSQENTESDGNKLDTITEIADDTDENQQETQVESSAAINNGEPEEVNKEIKPVNKDSAQQNVKEETNPNKEKLETLKNESNNSGTGTPTRSSARLAATTPSTVRTRRASRLAQNN